MRASYAYVAAGLGVLALVYANRKNPAYSSHSKRIAALITVVCSAVFLIHVGHLTQWTVELLRLNSWPLAAFIWAIPRFLQEDLFQPSVDVPDILPVSLVASVLVAIPTFFIKRRLYIVIAVSIVYTVTQSIVDYAHDRSYVLQNLWVFAFNFAGAIILAFAVILVRDLAFTNVSPTRRFVSRYGWHIGQAGLIACAILWFMTYRFASGFRMVIEDPRSVLFRHFAGDYGFSMGAIHARHIEGIVDSRCTFSSESIAALSATLDATITRTDYVYERPGDIDSAKGEEKTLFSAKAIPVGMACTSPRPFCVTLHRQLDEEPYVFYFDWLLSTVAHGSLSIEVREGEALNQRSRHYYTVYSPPIPGTIKIGGAIVTAEVVDRDHDFGKSWAPGYETRSRDSVGDPGFTILPLSSSEGPLTVVAGPRAKFVVTTDNTENSLTHAIGIYGFRSQLIVSDQQPFAPALDPEFGETRGVDAIVGGGEVRVGYSDPQSLKKGDRITVLSASGPIKIRLEKADEYILEGDFTLLSINGEVVRNTPWGKLDDGTRSYVMIGMAGAVGLWVGRRYRVFRRNLRSLLKECTEWRKFFLGG